MWPFTRRKKIIQASSCVLCDEPTRDDAQETEFWTVHKTCWLQFWREVGNIDAPPNPHYAVLRIKERRIQEDRLKYLSPRRRAKHEALVALAKECGIYEEEADPGTLLKCPLPLIRYRYGVLDTNAKCRVCRKVIPKGTFAYEKDGMDEHVHCVEED